LLENYLASSTEGNLNIVDAISSADCAKKCNGYPFCDLAEYKNQK